MRCIRFSSAGKTAYGYLEGSDVTEVAGDPFAGYEPTRHKHALGDIKIEIPVIPRTFYCAGLNYTAHVKAEAARDGVVANIPVKPDIGYRANNALIAHGENVVIPHDANDRIEYEGELVVVIGKTAKNLSESEALSCVLGYAIGNDVSERAWLRTDRTFWRAKNADTFKPMGPWIETDVDLEAMETVVQVNGVETTRFRTNDMLFGIATYIAAMTRYLTLHPGDVIWMGTDGGSPNLQHGDVVDITISGIGTLQNTFIKQERPSS